MFNAEPTFLDLFILEDALPIARKDDRCQTILGGFIFMKVGLAEVTSLLTI